MTLRLWTNLQFIGVHDDESFFLKRLHERFIFDSDDTIVICREICDIFADQKTHRFVSILIRESDIQTCVFFLFADIGFDIEKRKIFK